MPVEQPEPREYEPGAAITAPDRSMDTASAGRDASTPPVAPVEDTSGSSTPPGAPVGDTSGPAPAELEADAPVEVRVRRLVAGLEGIDQLPLAEHAPRYADVHAQLQGALTEIDGESGG